ncbi:hypothetical protein EK904_009130 [Melospiza melodia maxima]|nr:hypothetical protein EK904_009130 [Melospiza melodia maxima]
METLGAAEDVFYEEEEVNCYDFEPLPTLLEDETLCITPDTLAFNTNGNVCFMEQLSVVAYGFILPEENYNLWICFPVRESEQAVISALAASSASCKFRGAKVTTIQ